MTDIDKAAQEAWYRSHDDLNPNQNDLSHGILPGYRAFTDGFRAGAEWREGQQRDRTPAESDYESMNHAWFSKDRTEMDDRYIVGFAEGIQIGRRQRVPEGWLQRVIWALDHASGMAAVHGDFEFQRALQEIIAIVPKPEQDNEQPD